MRQKPVYYTCKDQNCDPSEHPVTHGHIRDKQAFALGPLLYRIPAVHRQAMAIVRYFKYAGYDCEARSCGKSRCTTRSRIRIATPRSTTVSLTPRQRASALGLALYHSQALLIQAGCTTVTSVLEIPCTIRGLSVNNRNAIQGRSEREGLFVTDVAESM